MTDSPPWWRAASLAERAAAVRGAGEAPPERVERFTRDFPDEEILAERLRIAGVERGRLASVLNGAAGPPPGMAEPEWWHAVTEAYGVAVEPPPPGDAAHDAELMHGARLLTAPLQEAARRELEAAAERALAEAGASGATRPFEPPAAGRLLARTVGAELAAMAAPAVALDLQAARLAGDIDEHPECTAEFMREFGDRACARELLAENAALARMLHRRLRLGVDAGGELLRHLAADWAQLRSGLLGPDPGALSGIGILGDAHAGGWRVLRLEFAHGARVVHKPRSLGADTAYAGLLDWLGRAGFEPAMRTPAILARDGYGWQEWVDTAPCESPEGVARWFTRLGGQLAVLHALHAVDLHHENVIACGDHPMLVDLEGLLHPRLGGDRAAEVDPLIAETSMDCVLRVGLLPRADVAFDVDVSGLGGDPNAEVLMRPGANRPRLGDEPVSAHEHVDALAAGFASAYRLMVDRRDELIAPGGPLEPFANVETRVILRPTRAYAHILARQLSDPPALADGLAREEVINVLWRGARRRPDLRAAAAAEHHDLLRGDIPRITTRPGTADGFHYAAGRIPGMLAPERTPTAAESVARLDERDLERQLAFVRAAVMAKAGAAPPMAADHDSAGDVVRRLDVLALREGDRAGWLTAVEVPQHPGRVLRLAGPDLRHGHAGIAYFLARYAAVTGEGEDLAQAAARQLAAQLGGSPPPPVDVEGLQLAPWGSDPVELPGLAAGLAGLGLELLAQASRGTTSRNSSASVGRTSVK